MLVVLVSSWSIANATYNVVTENQYCWPTCKMFLINVDVGGMIDVAVLCVMVMASSEDAVLV